MNKLINSTQAYPLIQVSRDSGKPLEFTAIKVGRVVTYLKHKEIVIVTKNCLLLTSFSIMIKHRPYRYI